ncbi:hypothetical protein FB157_105376 [Streptomyces sp. BK340]|nr:hypothetical protein FB157_105376 [Streptomyces sp. BK340]
MRKDVHDPYCDTVYDSVDWLKKARVSDLGLKSGAGDESRTRALSLGSDGACRGR